MQLLYNFFADSLPNSKTKNQWRGLLTFLNKVFPDHAEVCPPVVCKQLAKELKMLYVGLSRARVNLWLYDSNLNAHYSFFQLLKLMKLVKTVGSPDEEKQAAESLAKQSTKQAWKRKGIKLFNQALVSTPVLPPPPISTATAAGHSSHTILLLLLLSLLPTPSSSPRSPPFMITCKSHEGTSSGIMD